MYLRFRAGRIHYFRWFDTTLSLEFFLANWLLTERDSRGILAALPTVSNQKAGATHTASMAVAR